MSNKLLTEHHLECLSLKDGCTGSSESTLVKMPHCWKSHVTAQMFICTGQKTASFSNNGSVMKACFETAGSCLTGALSGSNAPILSILFNISLT